MYLSISVCLSVFYLSLYVCMFVYELLRVRMCVRKICFCICVRLCARAPASSCVRVYVIFCIEVISFAFELVTALC